MTRVLVVEDEESFSDALSYMLPREGFEVPVADSGPDGLDQFERHGADLVMLDLMLPGLSGTEVCRRLRQRCDVPVIMLTARDSEVDKVVGLELGADDYVTKPFSARELVARIRAVMRRAVTRRRSGRQHRRGRAGPDGRRAAHSERRRTGRVAAAQGVRAARAAAAQRRSRAHARPAHRPGVGHRLRRRHEDARRARQATAEQIEPIPAPHVTWSPCAAWVTSSSRERCGTAESRERPRDARRDVVGPERPRSSNSALPRAPGDHRRGCGHMTFADGDPNGGQP